jgi:hypothetical protein
MKLNLNQSGDQILLDLVYRTTGLFLLRDSVEFNTPAALPEPGPWGPDTIVTITADLIEDDRFQGSRELSYRRLHLDDVITTPDTPITLPALPFQTTDLLPAINQLYRLRLTANDVVNTSYTSYSDSVVLTAAPGSLVYNGAVTLVTQTPTPPLMITMPDLNGFQPATF